MNDQLIQPSYNIQRANESLSLDVADATLANIHCVQIEICKLVYRFLPEPKLMFQADLISENLDFMFSGSEHKLTVNGDTIDVIRTSCVMSDEKAYAEFLPNPALVELGSASDTELCYVIFHIFNFTIFSSRGEKFKNAIYRPNENSSFSLGQVVLTIDEFEITIQELPWAKDVVKQLNSEGGYGMTHAGKIKSITGVPFSAREVNETLDKIRVFLSFANGAWIISGLPVGYNSDNHVVYSSLGLPLCSPWKFYQTWFDSMNGQVLPDIFPGFCKLLDSVVFGAPIKRAIYWYIRANKAGSVDGIEGSLILSHAALDCIASAVIDNDNLTFEQGAGGRIRAVCKHFNIPIDIPSGRVNTYTAYTNGQWKDIPDAINKMRNELIHPNARLHVDHSKVLSEIWSFSQWYVELFILRLCNFNGSYSDRIQCKWRGEVMPVPWAQK